MIVLIHEGQNPVKGVEMKTLPVKGKLCLCSVFHGLFSRPPTERATSGGKRAQTRTTGEKQCTGYRTGLLNTN